MTQRESGQDFDPKHRIIGAIVIVALAVILIPMILSNRQSPTERPDAQPLAPGESAAEPDKVAVTKLAPPESVDESKQATVQVAPETDAPSPAVAAAKSSEVQAAAAPTKAPAADAGAKAANAGWVVQVGTFSNAANATRLEKKLRAVGQPLLVEHITLEGHKAVRLRVGPFHEHTAALKAQARIRKEVGVKGVVLAYP